MIHDKGNAEVGWGVREAGNNTTWTDASRLMNALPSHRKEKGSRTRHRIVDVVATDQNGEKSAIDFMVTRVKPRAAGALHAAKAGEKMKCHKYGTFLQRCAEENPHDDSDWRRRSSRWCLRHMAQQARRRAGCSR